jgi:hypothetical protein
MLSRLSGSMALGACCVTAVLAAAPDDQSIRDLVREAGVTPRPALPQDLLNARVGNGAERSTDREYIFAGWTIAARRLDTLHVLAIDRETGAWRHRRYKDDPDGDLSLASGSVLEVHASLHFITLEMHHNPSASATWVLRRDLSRAGAFYGWIKELLPNELMVYEQSELHFAPTHYVEISIYDPFAAQTRQIYPIAGGTAVRRTFVAGVKARWDALGQDWFMAHNHHGDPERFDSSSGRFAVDRSAQSMAFEVQYDDFTGTADGRSAASERTIVSCEGLARAATTRCGESAESAWVAAVPGVDADARLREAAAHPRLVPWK